MLLPHHPGRFWQFEAINNFLSFSINIFQWIPFSGTPNRLQHQRSFPRQVKYYYKLEDQRRPNQHRNRLIPGTATCFDPELFPQKAYVKIFASKKQQTIKEYLYLGINKAYFDLLSLKSPQRFLQQKVIIFKCNVICLSLNFPSPAGEKRGVRSVPMRTVPWRPLFHKILVFFEDCFP